MAPTLRLVSSFFRSYFYRLVWHAIAPVLLTKETRKMLTDDLSIFTEKGGTIAFLLAKKEIVVVDSQFPDQSKHLIDELKKRSDKPFKLSSTHTITRIIRPATFRSRA